MKETKPTVVVVWLSSLLDKRHLSLNKVLLLSLQAAELTKEQIQGWFAGCTWGTYVVF